MMVSMVLCMFVMINLMMTTLKFTYLCTFSTGIKRQFNSGSNDTCPMKHRGQMTIALGSPGKKLNPLTGRFVKNTAQTTPRTFQDPISLETMKKSDGVELNKVWYGKKGLRDWLNSGKNTIPHSRRALTDAELKKVYTEKDGKQVARKIAAHTSPVRNMNMDSASNNNNANNNWANVWGWNRNNR